ncbi:12162_t:CDS:1 [Dentiscutata heterogama]|uniref:12162_t:CDS:1 n=1 Tax=Dentiscutata heterogama TaxID=1316150 RepID=A0ACA9PWL2_9GLOM|nr:12162_t:CDS:1 [Dentiscutata heterogama]
MSPRDRGKKFENNVRNFLVHIGCTTSITKVPDNGFDITTTFDKINVVFQLKYHYISEKKVVSINVSQIREFVGAFETRYKNSDFYGIFLTNSGIQYSSECQIFKNSHPRIFLCTIDNLFQCLYNINRKHITNDTNTFNFLTMEATNAEGVSFNFNGMQIEYKKLESHVIRIDKKKNGFSPY